VLFYHRQLLIFSSLPFKRDFIVKKLKILKI
jgi:hypothetical protein